MTAGRLEQVATSALATFEQAFCEQTVGRLSEGTRMLLNGLVTHDAGGTLALIKADPGRVSLETLLGEVGKLAQVTGLGLSALAFTDVSERVLHAWQARAMRAYPSDLRAAAEPVRLTLLAALGAMRQAEITDALVDLLNSLILKISTRAERRVEGELMADLRKVRNKDGLLFAVADAALARPDDSVRSVVYPVVGEATLRDLVREAKANQQAFQTRVRTVLSGSYSGHYRRMLPHLLGALEFRSNNTAYQSAAGRETNSHTQPASGCPDMNYRIKGDAVEPTRAGSTTSVIVRGQCWWARRRATPKPPRTTKAAPAAPMPSSVPSCAELVGAPDPPDPAGTAVGSSAEDEVDVGAAVPVAVDVGEAVELAVGVGAAVVEGAVELV